MLFCNNRIIKLLETKTQSVVIHNGIYINTEMELFPILYII